MARRRGRASRSTTSSCGPSAWDNRMNLAGVFSSRAEVLAQPSSNFSKSWCVFVCEREGVGTLFDLKCVFVRERVARCLISLSLVGHILICTHASARTHTHIVGCGRRVMG